MPTTIDRRIPPLLALCAALAMVGVTGWQGYEFWHANTDRPVADTAKEISGPSSPSESTISDVELTQLALFGQAPSTQSAPVPETENLPKTNLRLILRGALAADGEFPGSALIEHPDGETEVYMVGDSLPGDARLRTVLSNRVILERNGKLENLYFPETENRNGLELISNRQSQPASPERQAQKEEIRRRLEQTRQRLQENN
ncbi:MAG: type II secretion system protein N [Marinobacter sp.]|nr:type II secretion system protein N [Marinobacter sp.]